MAHLFQIQDKVVFPNPETILISPFKEIWGRDKDKKKNKALKEFAYMEFMASVKKSNPYKGYNEQRRHETIVNDVIKDPKWKPDKLIFEGILKIKEFQTEASSTYSYYLAIREATEKMKQFLLTVSLDERNFKTGTPIYKPKEITSALIDTEKVLTNLNAIEVKVEEELFEETKNRANKEISVFADPSSLVRR